MPCGFRISLGAGQRNVGHHGGRMSTTAKRVKQTMELIVDMIVAVTKRRVYGGILWSGFVRPSSGSDFREMIQARILMTTRIQLMSVDAKGCRCARSSNGAGPGVLNPKAIEITPL